ncbi:MAG: molybdopterin-dependent oxidoreductase [Pseudonocardia sp.]
MSTAAPPQATRPTAPGIPRPVAALIGFLAVGAALGVGHLVAGPISPSSSPFLAVGDTVIRYSPPFLTEFAKTTFGTADKPVLLGGMAVVIGLIATVAGIASRRAPRVGVTVITVLGVLGLLTVVNAPVFAPLDVLAPVVALGVGVGSFRLLHRVALRDCAEPDAGPPARANGAVPRRDVLIGSSIAVGLGAIGAGTGGQLLATNIGDSRTQVTRQVANARVAPAPPIPPGADFAEFGSPTFITPNPAFYRVDAALLIPSQAASDWSMRIHGMVDREVTLTFDDLLRRPLVERTITLTCVSNEVGGRYISTANFIGVDLRDLLLEAGVQPGADQVLSTGADGGWTAGTPTDVLLEPDRDSMLAIGMNGEALPPEHGFPVRMVVPGLYGFLSATKWLTDIEVTTFDAAQGYWLQRGWGQKAPIKTQSRIDSPRPFATVPAGRVSVAGIAWSQPVGIERVDVRVDRGAWQAAELTTEVNYDTWRMWKAEFDLGPGSRTVQVRATDRNGITQPEVRVEPIPDGATGWHSTIFTVR